MDDVDLSILTILRDRGRITLTDLASEVHVSRTNVHGRLARLHERGVIRSYAASIDGAKVGLPLSALILIGVDQSRLEELRVELDRMEAIEHWGLTMGEYDGFIFVRVKGIEELRELIVSRLREVPGISRTQSVLIIDESPFTQALPASADDL